MIVSKSEMDKVNRIQLNIFKAFIDVCDKLHLRYYLIHGSLLGAVVRKKLMPLDDDIDVAMPREDYEILIRDGQQLINQKYFIQSNISDKNYPLQFTKIRDNNTTWIADSVQYINMHHGIFIDVFPIDRYQFGRIRDLKLKLLCMRINCKLFYKKKTLKCFVLQLISKIAYPSWVKAINKVDILNKKSKGKNIVITGGKKTDKNIPSEWFANGIKWKFEGIDVMIPVGYNEYLNKIYGDYIKCSLLENKIHSNDSVEINAVVLDTIKSFNCYRSEKWTRNGEKYTQMIK